MSQCPYCQATEKQVKAGLTEVGSQRFRCNLCQRRYTPAPKLRGYPEAMRHQAVRLYAAGMNFRRIARQLGVNHQTVINWINAYAASLPSEPPLPEETPIIELDELHSFIGRKKRGLHHDNGGSAKRLRSRLSDWASPGGSGHARDAG